MFGALSANGTDRKMIGAAQFARINPEAYFITTARGFIHDEEALAEALDQKQIAGAGLDVWEDEPPPHDHPLMTFDNVIVSPHVAGSTIEARENMGRIAAEQALGILDGKKPPRLIDPEVWPAYRERFERIMGSHRRPDHGLAQLAPSRCLHAQKRKAGRRFPGGIRVCDTVSGVRKLFPGVVFVPHGFKRRDRCLRLLRNTRACARGHPRSAMPDRKLVMPSSWASVPPRSVAGRIAQIACGKATK